jgi:DTW domain-containing protein YfiP
MSDTARRSQCIHCRLPSRTCLCALVTPVRNRVEVLVLQHPAEAREAKGSVRLMRLSLASCRVVVGEVFEPETLLALLDGDVTGVALLYPAGAAEAVPESRPAFPTRLVALDGTWRKSLRMLHANPLLQTLPRWPVVAAQEARYRALRKARRPAQLSSLEATCAALSDIEAAPLRYAPLLEAFDRFVADRVARARPSE